MGDNEEDERKTESHWIVELGKDWTELGIDVEGNEFWGNKYTQTDMPELNDKEGSDKNRIEKHQCGRQRTGY